MKVEKPQPSTKIDEDFATQIADNYPILKRIIKPEHNTYTGLGTILITIPYYFQFSISFGMLMLIVCFFSKIVEQKITLTHLIIGFLALIFIINTNYSEPFPLHFEYLWGFWFCLGLIILMLIWDYWVIKQNNQSNNKI